MEWGVKSEIKRKTDKSLVQTVQRLIFYFQTSLKLYKAEILIMTIKVQNLCVYLICICNNSYNAVQQIDIYCSVCDHYPKPQPFHWYIFTIWADYSHCKNSLSDYIVNNIKEKYTEEVKQFPKSAKTIQCYVDTHNTHRYIPFWV